MAAHSVARLSAEWFLQYQNVDGLMIMMELRRQGVDPSKTTEEWIDVETGDRCYWNPPEEKTDHA